MENEAIKGALQNQKCVIKSVEFFTKLNFEIMNSAMFTIFSQILTNLNEIECVLYNCINKDAYLVE